MVAVEIFQDMGIIPAISAGSVISEASGKITHPGCILS